MSPVLKNKVAIITGAGRGIGREFALRFASEGAKLLLPDINPENASKVADSIKARGGEAIAIGTDVSSENSTQKMAEAAMQRYGRVDILLNNAAIYGGLVMKPWDSLTVEEWDRLFAVNVKGTWLACKAIAPLMVKQGKGKIINISSNIVRCPPFAGDHIMHYTVSKAAVYTMTQALARALGPSGINVNAIGPGLTASQASLDMLDEQGWKPIVAEQCLPRREEPVDLVGTAVFLASEDSDFITGQLIVVDGGSWLR